MTEWLYVVEIQDETDKVLHHKFMVPVPADPRGPAPSERSKTAFLQGIPNQYAPQVMTAAKYKCRGCGKKATHLVAQPALYSVGPEPFVMDYSKAVCRDPRCDVIVRQQTQAVNAQKGISELERFLCAKCGKEAKLAKCARCRVVSYCSKECQQQHWPQHKPACTPLVA